jgi:hypothetical protein
VFQASQVLVDTSSTATPFSSPRWRMVSVRSGIRHDRRMTPSRYRRGARTARSRSRPRTSCRSLATPYSKAPTHAPFAPPLLADHEVITDTTSAGGRPWRS